jgi:hypothetical protein
MNATLSSLKVYEDGIRKTLGETLSESELSRLLDHNDFSVLDGKTLTEKQITDLEQYRDALYEANRAIDEFLPNVH